MSTGEKPFVILLVDDDEADQELTRRALRDTGFTSSLIVVQNGEEALDYLLRRGAFESAAGPRPDLVLLDLNMPKMDGRRFLREFQGHEALKTLPVVVLTTSQHEQDVAECYKLGARSYIVKPADIGSYKEKLRALQEQWIGVGLGPSAEECKQTN